MANRRSAYFAQGGDVALYWIMQPRDEFSTLDVASVDLDPETDGVQSELTVEAGELSVSDGVLTLTPADGFTGRGEITYVVSDAEGPVSAPAMVTLRVSEAD